MGRKAIEMVGKVFYQLTVLHRDGSNGDSQPLFMCKCTCGNLTRVRGNYLRIGKTKSCGCRTTATHNMSKHPLWGVWNSMRQRCNNSNTRSYKFYGAKGIKVCKQWSQSIPFIKWAMMNGWKPGLTLDRIDDQSDYSPENCRFITRAENSLRKRGNGKNVGKIFGSWKIVEKLPYDKYVTTQCIHCSKKDYISSSNVCAVSCRQCKCTIA